MPDTPAPCVEDLQLLRTLLQLPGESEVVELKEAKDNFDFDKLGKYFSALSNEANLRATDQGWLLFGVNDQRQVVGTNYRPEPAARNTLIRDIAEQTGSRLTFRSIREVTWEGKRVLLFEIPPALLGLPTTWKGHYYGRDGESLGPLNPDERRRIERQLHEHEFEKEPAMRNVTATHVRELLDCEGFFRLFRLPFPSSVPGVIEKLLQERLIARNAEGRFDITNLGAILFARDLQLFDRLEHKGLRVFFYEGHGPTSRVKMRQEGRLGYALGFLGLINYLNERLPSNEAIEEIRREVVPVYPILALRELVANALIHQDFTIRGAWPTVEVFADRIEITNPGAPIIDTQRFIDHAPQSRNEALAAMMRRLEFCELRGSGIDRVVEECEKYQLPAPNFIRGDNYTRAILFSPRPLRLMDKPDKIRACYQHACLKYTVGEQMTNQTFRERMNIEEKN